MERDGEGGRWKQPSTDGDPRDRMIIIPSPYSFISLYYHIIKRIPREMLLKSFKRRVPRAPALSFNLIILSAKFSGGLMGMETAGWVDTLSSITVIFVMHRDRTYHYSLYFFTNDHRAIYLARLWGTLGPGLNSNKR